MPFVQAKITISLLCLCLIVRRQARLIRNAVYQTLPDITIKRNATESYDDKVIIVDFRVVRRLALPERKIKYFHEREL